MGKDWLARLQRYDNVIKEHTNPFNSGVHTCSPSADFVYGNGTWLLPFGYSEVLYGPPKGGKSVFAKMKIGQLHQEDPEAYAVVFDTEFRWRGQLTPEKAKAYGIDMKRVVIYEGNNPMEVFDRLEGPIVKDLDDGMPLKYIIVDSVSGILGRRELDSSTVETQQIGDHALTVQTGLKRILPTIRKYKLATTLVTQVRSEMDMIEQKRGNKVKMNASFGLQHFAEYFVFVAPNRNKEGRSDLQGREMVDESMTDLADNGEKTGHKMKVTMKDSSMGPKGRTGEFTFDYKKGVINIHEEVFRLGIGRGVIECPTKGWYSFGGKKWHGMKDTLNALEESPEMQAAVVKDLKERDLRGDYRAMDVKLEAGISIDDLGEIT